MRGSTSATIRVIRGKIPGIEHHKSLNPKRKWYQVLYGLQRDELAGDVADGGAFEAE